MKYYLYAIGIGSEENKQVLVATSENKKELIRMGEKFNRAEFDVIDSNDVTIASSREQE